MQSFISEIREYCAAHEDPAKKDKYARYFREGYDSWGLLDKEHPIWTEKCPEWLERHRDAELSLFFQLGEELFRSPKYEEGAIALRLLKSRAGELSEEHLPCLARWFEAGIRNWAHTDVLCGEILEPHIASARIPFSALVPWRESPLRFQRRAVPVAMLGLVKKKATQPVKPLLEFLRPLMLDEERVVHQGLGWFLREAWKKEPKPVEKLLSEYKDTAARTIFQYATEKMTPEQKERFRAGKRSSRKATVRT